jgi:hypothetical protein
MPSLLSAVLTLAILAPMALGAGRDVAPRPPIANPTGSPAVVAAAGGRFLSAWLEPGGMAPSRIMAVLSDGRGAPLGPAFLVAELPQITTTTRMLDAAGTGDSFAVFWNDDSGLTHMIDVALDGRVLETRELALSPHGAPHVAWNGRWFLLTGRERTFPGEHIAAVFARNGAVQTETRLTGRRRVLDILPTPERFLVFTATNEGPAEAFGVDDRGGVTRSQVGTYWVHLHSAVLGNGNALLVSSGSRLIAKAFLPDGTVTPFQVLDPQASRVLFVLPGMQRHLVGYSRDDGDRTALFTIFVDDDGKPLTEAVNTGVVLPANASVDDFDGAGTAARYFTAYRAPGITGIAVDRNGLTFPPAALSIEPADQSLLFLGSGNGALLAAWQQTGSGGKAIRAGIVGGTDHEVFANATLADVAWSGSEFLAVLLPRYGLVAVRMHADGSPVAAPPIQLWSDTPALVAATWAGDRYAVVWSRDHFLYYATVTPDGIASSMRPLVRTSPVTDPIVQIVVREVALAFDGDDLHVTWIEHRDDTGTSAVYTTRIDRDGDARDTRALALPSSQPVRLATAAVDGTLLVLVDEVTHTTVHTIDATRAVASRTLYDWPANSDVAWDGMNFVAALRAHGIRWCAHVFRLGRDGSTIGARGIVTLPPQNDAAVSIAAVAGFDAALGVEERDSHRGTRAVVYDEDELAPLPSPAPPLNVRRIPGGIAWDDVGEAWLVEKVSDGGRIVAVSVDLTGVPRLLTGGTVRVRALVDGVPSASSEWIDLDPPLRRRSVRR